MTPTTLEVPLGAEAELEVRSGRATTLASGTLLEMHNAVRALQRGLRDGVATISVDGRVVRTYRWSCDRLILVDDRPVRTYYAPRGRSR